MGPGPVRCFGMAGIDEGDPGAAAAPPRKLRGGRLRDLARALARRCKGRTELWGRGVEELADLLRDAGVELVAVREAPPLPLAGQPPRTILLARCLELLDEAGAAELAAAAWERLAPAGRLVACVGHEDHAGDPAARLELDRRGVKKLLRPLGRARLAKDQPYCWLVAVLERGAGADRGERRRAGVIASLCRGRVLELGSGWGTISAAAAARGLEVLGLELDEAKAAAARERHPAVRFEAGDLFAASAEALGRFDTVVLSEVIEHFEPERGERALEVAWALVAPGGRLIVSVPNEDLVPHDNHLTEFSARSLKKLLRRFGPPRLADRQPLAWLLAWVERPAG